VLDKQIADLDNQVRELHSRLNLMQDVRETGEEGIKEIREEYNEEEMERERKTVAKPRQKEVIHSNEQEERVRSALDTLIALEEKEELLQQTSKRQKQDIRHPSSEETTPGSDTSLLTTQSPSQHKASESAPPSPSTEVAFTGVVVEHLPEKGEEQATKVSRFKAARRK